jgi:hypothetical protein
MENKNNSGLLVGLVITTLLAVVFGYLYFQERHITTKQDKDLEVRVSQLAAAEIKLDSISRQLDEKIAEIEGLGGDIAELQKVKAELEADRAALRKGTNTMSSKVKKYENFLAEKDKEIALLRAENQVLISQKDSLIASKYEVEQQFANTRTAYADTIKGITSVNKELESKVNQASALRARNVKVYAVSSKGKVREGENVKSKRIDKVRVDFILEKNPLTQQEPKTIYMRIVDPSGATISETSTGSGVFDYNNQEMAYTFSKDVNYSNSNQDVSILYNRTSDFKSGTYKVELYSEGYYIGEGSFSVK